MSEKNYDPFGINQATGTVELVAEEANSLNFFAAHAPDEIPGWFEHAPPPEPAYNNVNILHLSVENQRYLNSWKNDPCWDLEDEFSWYQDAINANIELMGGWLKKDQGERYFQWRVFYAKKMVEYLNREA